MEEKESGVSAFSLPISLAEVTYGFSGIVCWGSWKG